MRLDQKPSQPHPPPPPHHRLDERAGRFASALLLLAALVLAVDVVKAALYAWYSDGSFLRYSLGGEGVADSDGAGPGSSTVRLDWPRCQTAVPTVEPPSTAEPPLLRVARNAQVGAWLVDARETAALGLRVVGHLFGGHRRAPRSLVRVLSLASSAACLLMLLAAVLPVRLRLSSRRSCPAPNLWPRGVSVCALALSLAMSASASILGLAAISACIVKVYLLALCEVSLPARLAFTFIPACPILRKAAFCAECFCLLLLTAAACLALCLCVFYCRALQDCGGASGAADLDEATGGADRLLRGAGGCHLHHQERLFASPTRQNHHENSGATTIVREGSCGSCGQLFYSRLASVDDHHPTIRTAVRVDSACFDPMDEAEYYLTYR